MARVSLKPNDSIDVVLRRFKRAVEKCGVLTKARRCKFFEKPSAKRKRRAAAAVKRHLKKLAREKMYRLYGSSMANSTVGGSRGGRGKGRREQGASSSSRDSR